MKRLSESISPACPSQPGPFFRNRFWYIPILLVQLMVAASLLILRLDHSILILALATLLSISIFSVRMTLLLLILITITLPIRFFQYPCIPFFISPTTYTVGFLLLLFYFVLQVLKSRGLKLLRSSLNLPMGLFLLVVWLSALWGILRDHPISEIVHEACLLSFYATFWIVLNMSNPYRLTKKLFPILTALMVIVFLEYFYIAFREPHLLAARGGRIITRQANIAVIVFPYLTTLILISPSARKKVIYFLALSIPLTTAFLHQQRSIWIAILASGIFVTAYVFAKRAHISYKGVVIGVLSLILLLFLVNYQLGFIQKFADVQVKKFIETRVQTFRQMSAEPSILIRMIDLQAVLRKIKQYPIVGSGLGAKVLRPLGRIYLYIIDNSFVYLYWKTGIAGLAIFLWLLGAVFRKCFYILKRCRDDDTLISILPITAGMIGLVILSLASVILVAYRFIIVWATLIATVELTWLRVKTREATTKNGYR